jgi:hypothetical protein
MTTRKKKSSLLKKLNSKYKLAIFNEQTYEEVFIFRLSRLNAFTMVGAFGIVLIVLVTLLIAFTSLREFIPGYPSPNERLLIVRNAQRADSLSFEIERQVRFIENMQARLRGEEPEIGVGPGDKTKVFSASGTRDDIQFKKSDASRATPKVCGVSSSL